MNGKFFLDTNIFVYTFDQSAPAKARRALRLIRDAVDTQEGIVSYQVVQEFFHVALRRFSRPMSVADAERYLATVFRPLLAIHSSEELYQDSFRLANRYGLSWYDALIVAAALEGQCSVLYSEDLQTGQLLGSLRVINPFL